MWVSHFRRAMLKSPIKAQILFSADMVFKTGSKKLLVKSSILIVLEGCLYIHPKIKFFCLV